MTHRKNNEVIEFKKIKRAQGLLRTLINNRYRPIFQILHDAVIPLTVTEIMIESYRVTGREYPQPEVSAILADFRKYNLVHSERKGKFVMYTLNYERIEYINNKVHDIVKEWVDVEI